MSYDDFARDWQECWNSHDLERILHHYTDDIIFHSAKAVAVLGVGEIRGKKQLRDYWGAALVRQPNLHFVVSDVFKGHEMLTICYLNQRQVRAVETLYFNQKGLVYRAAACHRT